MSQVVLLAFLLICFSIQSEAQHSSNLTSNVSVTTLLDPPRLVFNWTPAKNVTSQSMQRRLKKSRRWKRIAKIDPGISTFTDEVELGVNYEYQLRSAGDVLAIDYLSAGVEVEPTFLENNDMIVVLIDSMLVDTLENEIEIMKQDMANDGWIVRQMITTRQQTDVEIKDSLQTIYAQSNKLLKAIFILGHVTVPYAGNFAWDGHGNHQGAWPADVYYGVMSGRWTDNSINNTTPSRAENDNVPGDGKWDNVTIPSPAEIAVGRADFYNLPAFQESEIELTRKYLNKLHGYKTLQIQAVNRALIDDNFGYRGGEAFSQSGWRNFATFFPRDSIYSKSFDKVDYFTDLGKRSYLWAYGCGGGSYRSAGGIGNTFDYDTTQIQAIFTQMFGSYFGDWDVQNSFLRAALASGTALTNCWGGRPVWFMHHMALGEDIGYSTRLSQNSGSSQYQPVGTGATGSHVSLMGDPTLRMYLFEGPSELLVSNIGNGSAKLEWTGSTDKEVLGYHIYRRLEDELIYARVSQEIIVDDSFIDTIAWGMGDYIYLVRAVKLQVTQTGSFYNLSPGVMGAVEVTTFDVDMNEMGSIHILPNPVSAYFTLSGLYEMNDDLIIMINDINGHQVYLNEIRSGDQKFDINHLVAGTYFVTILDSNSETISLKLIKK